VLGEQHLVQENLFNLKQIIHSLNLRSPLFRIDWCGTQQLANPPSLIASGAAVAFIRCSLLFFKGPQLQEQENSYQSQTNRPFTEPPFTALPH
jgi:hypothetical protein